MLTPQEVSERAFAKASFGGYNMSMVDEFLDVLTADYTTLYKENATLKAKMKVLVDKVEEYRSTEDAMRKALLTAQKMADELVAQAEEKRDQMLKNAEADAKARVGELQQCIRDEERRLAAAREATAAYVGKLKELYQHEMDYLSGLSKLTAPTPAADRVADTVRDIEQSVEKLVEEEQPVAQEEPKKEGGLYAELLELNLERKQPVAAGARSEEEEEDDEPTEPTRRIDFDHLQFGKDYEIR